MYRINPSPPTGYSLASGIAHGLKSAMTGYMDGQVLQAEQARANEKHAQEMVEQQAREWGAFAMRPDKTLMHPSEIMADPVRRHKMEAFYEKYHKDELGKAREKFTNFKFHDLGNDRFVIGMDDPKTGKHVPLSSDPSGREPMTLTIDQLEQQMKLTERQLRGLAQVYSYGTMLERTGDPYRAALGADDITQHALGVATGLDDDQLRAIDSGYRGQQYAPPPRHRYSGGVDHGANWDKSSPIMPTREQVNTPFDPEGDGYDYKTAIEAGLAPSDKNGHWPSRDPRTGQMLKGKAHPTFQKAIDADEEMGYTVKKGEDGKYYSNEKKADESDSDHTNVTAKDMAVAEATGLVGEAPPEDDSWWDKAVALEGEDIAEWVKENPAEAAGYALMFIPGIGWAGAGARALIGLARAKNWGTKALNLFKKLNVKARRTFGDTTRKYGGKRVPLNKKTYKTKAQAEAALRASNFGKLNKHKVVETGTGEYTLAPTMGNVATSKGTAFVAGAGMVASQRKGAPATEKSVVSPAQQQRAQKEAQKMSESDAMRVVRSPDRYARFKQAAAIQTLQSRGLLDKSALTNFLSTGNIGVTVKDIDAANNARNARKEKLKATHGDYHTTYKLYAGDNEHPYFDELDFYEFVHNTRVGGWSLNPKDPAQGALLVRAMRDLERTVRSKEHDGIPFNSIDKSDIKYQTLEPFIALRLVNREFTDSEMDDYATQLYDAFGSIADARTRVALLESVAQVAREQPDLEIDDIIEQVLEAAMTHNQ